MDFPTLRKKYHQNICQKVIRITDEVVNFADGHSKASKEIARKITELLGCNPLAEKIPGQTAGKRFEEATKDFIAVSFELLQHLRPGEWQYLVGADLTTFAQYHHLADLEELLSAQRLLKSMIGQEHIIMPDIIVARVPIKDLEINANTTILPPSSSIARHTDLLKKNNPYNLLHASISCKWTLRNDRSQNTRSEALNLIRHRKGHTPHIVAVTAEPLPTRIAALALGTGDIDCVYHFALYELEEAVKSTSNEDQFDMLQTLIEGRRLRDISDLPFDLAI